MPRTLIALLLCVAAAGMLHAAELPAVTHQSLRIELFPKEARLEATAWVTVTNSTGSPQTVLPFLLYRLLEIESVRG